MIHSHKLKMIVAAGAVVLWAGLAFAQDSDGVTTLDLKTAVDLAMQLNPNLKIARDREDQAAAQIREVAAGALPQISLSTNYSRNLKRPAFFFKLGEEVRRIEIGSQNSYVGNVLFEQTIFSNGQLGVSKARRIASLFSEVSLEGTRLSKDEVIFNVRRAFYTVLLAERVAEVMQETLAQTRAHHDNVKKLVEKGVAAQFDLLRSEVEVADAQAALIDAQNDLDLAEAGLKNAIGLPLDKPVKVNGDLDFQPVPDTVLAQRAQDALANRPEMRQLKYQLEMARLNASIQKGSRFPSLSLTGTYQFQGQSSDFQFGPTERSTSFVAGLGLRFNIFDGFATRARIQQAQSQANEVLHQMEQVSQLVKVEVKRATLRMKSARQRIAAREKSVAQAQKAFDIAEVRYNNGVGTQLELSDARLALNRMKINYLQSVYDYNIAYLEWQKAVGIIE
ncbi:MAG: TolC family protein [Calditrichaeota bacterium]|nr:MAG: TolC family protein [Calditrichota bacterium]